MVPGTYHLTASVEYAEDGGSPGIQLRQQTVQLTTGIIQIGLFEFIQEMTTFQVTGPTPAARLNALTRFTTLFMGKLLDVYGGLLSTS